MPPVEPRSSQPRSSRQGDTWRAAFTWWTDSRCSMVALINRRCHTFLGSYILPYVLDQVGLEPLCQRFPTYGPLPTCVPWVAYWWAAERYSRVKVRGKESENTIK
ncbi:hypothetical protein AVEN_241428-1 [Araneus ventricosus]|uniref:Uncharacterized protein n=1 Tax=Araneus ventricosus TaxID=182803 RepID=A0A4Y2LZN9_ARAVE|nr:hypothetical protein AVEN_241428-1 [Araneus ventricosus]